MLHLERDNPMAVETLHHLTATPLDRLHQFGIEIKGIVGDAILRAKTGGYSTEQVRTARVVLGQEIPDLNLIERWKDRQRNQILANHPVIAPRSLPFEDATTLNLNPDVLLFIRQLDSAIDSLSPEKAWEDMTYEAKTIDDAVRSAKLPGWLVRSL